MFKNLKTVILIFLYINLTFSLNLNNFCYSTQKECWNENYKYKCKIGVCAANEESCQKYVKFRSHNSFYYTFRFKTNIKNCPKPNSLSNLNDFCENGEECFNDEFFSMSNYISNINCLCHGKYKFQCGKKYCTLSSAVCDTINQSQTSAEQLGVLSTKNKCY
jgi:hypothetical protein